MIDSFLRGFNDPILMIAMMLIGIWALIASVKKMKSKHDSGYLFLSIVGAAFFFSGFWNIIQYWLRLLTRPCA